MPADESREVRMLPSMPGLPWIVIPVKPFQETKTRLAPALDAQQRAALTRRLLDQQLATLAPFRPRARLAVISRGAEVLARATAAGVDGLLERPPYGLNSAAAQALAAAAAAGAPALLLLPVDLPWMSGADVADFLAEPAGQITIATDRHHQGTNGLRLPTHLPFRFQFGLNSLALHQEEAARLRCPATVLARSGLQFDLDTVDDWEIYQRWRLAADDTAGGARAGLMRNSP